MYFRGFFIFCALFAAAVVSIYSFQEKNSYLLLDPEMAPPEINRLVIRGYHLLQDTKKLLPEYAGDKISCTNCHFSAGNTWGGARNGLSLVGVSNIYPRHLESGELFTLSQRINGCFMRSMNGKPLPLDSGEMQSMVAYLEWISSGVPKAGEYPWLGIKPLQTKHIPSPENGAKIFEVKCAICHGKNGEGQERPDDLSYPPLWGPEAFNDGAGMNKLDTLAFFVHKNMPYDEPALSEEDALDVASFVVSRPRPRYHP